MMQTQRDTLSLSDTVRQLYGETDTQTPDTVRHFYGETDTQTPDSAKQLYGETPDAISELNEDIMQLKARHTYAESDTNTADRKMENQSMCGKMQMIENLCSESQSSYSDTKPVYSIHTRSQETIPSYPMQTHSPDTIPTFPIQTQSPETIPTFPIQADSPDTRHIYTLPNQSPDTIPGYPSLPESPDTCQTSQVSSSVSECLSYRQPGKTHSPDSGWDINDPDIPARIEQHVSNSIY